MLSGVSKSLAGLNARHITEITILDTQSRRQACRAIIANVHGAGRSRESARASCLGLAAELFRLDTGIDSGKLWICHEAGGAPRLQCDGAFSGHSISVSHSGDWVAVALSGHVDVGIDVEMIDRTRPTEKYQALLGWAGVSSDPVGFYSKWTLWEACFKAVRGISLAECNKAFEFFGDDAGGGSASQAGEWAHLGGRCADAICYSLVTRDRAGGDADKSFIIRGMEMQ